MTEACTQTRTRWLKFATCHGQITVSSRGRSGASSRSFVWVSIAYPGVVLFGVREASRVKKTREVKANACRGSKTGKVLAKRLSRVLRSPEGGSHGEEDE